MTKVVTLGRRVGSCTSRTAARAAREAEIEYDEEEAAAAAAAAAEGRECQQYCMEVLPDEPLLRCISYTAQLRPKKKRYQHG